MRGRLGTRPIAQREFVNRNLIILNVRSRERLADMLDAAAIIRHTAEGRSVLDDEVLGAAVMRWVEIIGEADRVWDAIVIELPQLRDQLQAAVDELPGPPPNRARPAVRSPSRWTAGRPPRPRGWSISTPDR